MYEFKTADFYEVAEVIKTAFDNDVANEVVGRDILFDLNVSTAIVKITSKRFRHALHEDDEEYYKRLTFLFKESYKRYRMMYKMYLQR